MDGKKKIMMSFVSLVVMVAFVVLLTSPQTATAIRNHDDVVVRNHDDVVGNLQEVVRDLEDAYRKRNRNRDNGDVVALSNIMLAETYEAKFGCLKCGARCGPLIWCCSGCTCKFNIIQGDFRCK